jgi:uncharacterized protein (DUF1697 family)
LGFTNVSHLLNSGNIIFSTQHNETLNNTNRIQNEILKVFGFEAPVTLIQYSIMEQLIKDNPFNNLSIDGDTKAYVTFIRKQHGNLDENTKALEKLGVEVLLSSNDLIHFTLNHDILPTVKVMEKLDSLFKKDVTTRNWNTIIKIYQRMNTAHTLHNS